MHARTSLTRPARRGAAVTAGLGAAALLLTACSGGGADGDAPAGGGGPVASGAVPVDEIISAEYEFDHTDEAFAASADGENVKVLVSMGNPS